MQLTEWFNDGTLPFRRGVYNVSCEKEGQSGNWYAYIDGDQMSCWAFSPERAYEHFIAKGLDYSTHVHLKSWRGVLKNER